MSNKKKFRLKPFHVFLATVVLVVFVVIVYDVATRKSKNVVEFQEDVVLGLEDMDMSQLRIKFDSIEVVKTRFRPSTLNALNERIDVARMMLKKSTTPDEENANRVFLMDALGEAYIVLRKNRTDYVEPEFVAVRKELLATIDLAAARNTGEDRRHPLLGGFRIAADQIADGSSTPETLEKIRQTCEALGKEFLDIETAARIEEILLPLTLNPALGPEVNEVISQVSKIYVNHPDKELREWSSKLTDDLVFRKLGLFVIHDDVANVRQDSAKKFLASLNDIIREPISPAGFDRLIGFCRELDSHDEYAVSLEVYRRIEQHLSQPELIEKNRENIIDCQNGIRRIESLGKIAQGEFVDAYGTSVGLDGELLRNKAILVLAVRSKREFESILKESTGVDGLRSLNTRLVVVCVGMDSATAKNEFGPKPHDDYFVVPDPDLNSVFYAVCPTESTPTFWLLSRDHKLADIQILPSQLTAIAEELRFAR